MNQRDQIDPTSCDLVFWSFWFRLFAKLDKSGLVVYHCGVMF